MRHILSTILLFVLMPICLAQEQSPPYTINAEVITVEDSVEAEQQDFSEVRKISVGRVVGSTGFAQLFNRIRTVQSVFVGAGKSLDDDREFYFGGVALDFSKNQLNSNWNLNLQGNWSDNEDPTTNQIQIDRLIDEDNDDQDQRFLRAAISYAKRISLTSQILVDVSQDRYAGFGQNNIGQSSSITYRVINSSRSEIGVIVAVNDQDNEPGTPLNSVSYGASYNYRIDQMNIVSVTAGQIRTRQNSSTDKNFTGGLNFVHLFSRNTVLVKEGEKTLTPDQYFSDEVEPTVSEIIDQIFLESLANTLTVSWARNLNSIQNGQALLVADTYSIGINYQPTVKSSISSSAQLTDNTVSSNQVSADERTFQSNLRLTYLFAEPEEGNPSPPELYLDAGYSKNTNSSQNITIERATATLGLRFSF